MTSRPDALACARLLYMEKQFRIRRPISLLARIDRAYQAADGTIVLVELKTRWKNRAYPTDVIQLSAQRMALEGQTGQRVAAHAFATVQKPTKTAAQRSYRVCAVKRRRFPVGASPTRQPLQPEATGAVMEVTKWLKPSGKRATNWWQRECAGRNASER